MTIRSGFNRFAAGLALGLAVGITAPVFAQASNAPALVPPGYNPQYLANIYTKLISESRLRDPSQFRIWTSITSLTDIPDDPWLRSLKNMPPDQAEQEVRSCLASFCEHKYPFLSATDKFTARAMVVEAMFHNGLDPEEFRVYSEFLSRFEADPAFYERDTQITRAAVRNILDSEEYRDIRDRILPMSRITTSNAVAQFHLRHDFMQFVANEVRTAFGYQPIPVYLDKFPAGLTGTGAVLISPGYVDELQGHQLILMNYMASMTDDIETIINTTVHEARHGVDFSYKSALLRKDFSAGDPRFTHTATILLNENAVVPLCATNGNARLECPQQFEWYRNQYRERSAVDFARKFVEEFRHEKRRRDNERQPVSFLRSLEPEKLQLPA